MNLIATTQSRDVFHYFLEIAEDPAFYDASEIVDNHMLEETLLLNMEQILQTAPILLDRRFFGRISKHQFMYGSATLNRQQVMVFYFEDIDPGMMALAPRTPIEEPMFVRFLCIDLERPLTGGTN